MTPCPPHLTISVPDRQSMDGQLDAAVERIKSHATAQRCGILVTRLAADRFSIHASTEIPFGETHEREG